MKWTTKRKDLSRWHYWFAWHPVQCEGENVWLEWILRKEESSMAGCFWMYKFDSRLDSLFNADFRAPAK